MRLRFTGLWRHPDFMKLWTGQTISIFGSLITRFALPLTAILLLKATPAQIALLSATELVPGLFVGLFAGALVDRLRRRPIMIWADIGRTLLLASIPLAAILHSLHIEQLYIVGFLISILTVFFDVAYKSYLPSLIHREQLVEGNSKLQASNSVAEVAGFGIAGVLIQVLTAPITILVDALSFGVSALSLLLIRTREPAPRSKEARSENPLGVWREIGQGLKLAVSNPILRTIMGASGIVNLKRGMIGVVILLFWTHDLHLTPAIMGLVSSVGGISSFVGAMLVERVTGRWGLGRTLLRSSLLDSFATLLTALAGGPIVLAVSMLVAQQLFGDGAATAFEINHISLVQAMVPGQLQGRINASIRVVEWAAMLLGLFLAGVLGQTIGLRPTLLIATGIGLLIPLWIAFSPVRALRAYPVLAVVPAVATPVSE